MKISKDIQAQARRLLRLCMGEDDRLQEDAVRRVAAALSQKRPRHYLELLTAFTQLVRMAESKRQAIIASAVLLTEEEQAQIRSKLEARKPGLRYDWQVQPELIAGIRVCIGDEVTDASVRARIQRLSSLQP